MAVVMFLQWFLPRNIFGIVLSFACKLLIVFEYKLFSIDKIFQDFLWKIFIQHTFYIPYQTDLELPSLSAGDSIYDYNVNPETGR